MKHITTLDYDWGEKENELGEATLELYVEVHLQPRDTSVGLMYPFIEEMYVISIKENGRNVSKDDIIKYEKVFDSEGFLNDYEVEIMESIQSEEQDRKEEAAERKDDMIREERLINMMGK